MISLAIRIGFAVITVAFTAYKIKRLWDNNAHYANNYTDEAPRRIRICVICNSTVSSSEAYENECNCFCHTYCMEMILREGQNVCPGCKEPLRDRGTNNMWGPARHSRFQADRRFLS